MDGDCEAGGRSQKQERRWTAALTGLGLTDLVYTTSKKDLLLYISETMNRSRGIRDIFMRTFILAEARQQLAMKTIISGLIAQIKLVWEFYEMCSYQFMSGIIFKDYPVLGIEVIAREAAQFKIHYDNGSI